MWWEDVRDGALHVLYGKTDNARRTIPLTQRVAAQFDMCQADAATEWVCPAPATATSPPRADSFLRSPIASKPQSRRRGWDV